MHQDLIHAKTVLPLDFEWFVTTKQAQTAINAWLKQYNHIRLHPALNMRPPVPETLLKNGT